MPVQPKHRVVCTGFLQSVVASAPRANLLASECSRASFVANGAGRRGLVMHTRCFRRGGRAGSLQNSAEHCLGFLLEIGG